MTNFPGWISRQNIFVAIISGAIIFGLTGLFRDISASRLKRQAHPYFFSGEIFAGIKGAQGTETYIGYLTDRDINNDAVSLRFTQAQFTLAPAVLDFGNARHRLIILDFHDEKKALAEAITLSLRPLKRSPQGIILAERPGL